MTFGFRDSAALRTAAVTVRVVPRVTLRATAGGRVQGRVAGAPAGLRKVVELQAFRGGAWRTLASTRLAATSGTFSLPASRARRAVSGRSCGPTRAGRS